MGPCKQFYINIGVRFIAYINYNFLYHTEAQNSIFLDKINNSSYKKVHDVIVHQRNFVDPNDPTVHSVYREHVGASEKEVAPSTWDQWTAFSLILEEKIKNGGMINRISDIYML